AFGLQSTYPFTECFVDGTGVERCTDVPALPAVKSFTDDRGWVPGLELRNGSLFYRYADGSAVVPSVDNQPYTTRIVDPSGNPVTSLFGMDLGFTKLGTGNPADAGVGYGTAVTVTKTLDGNRTALISITPPTAG
ncbi:MAG TPA: protease, partial [Agromyces sp.]|nr:protease [Agromyces sp.]